MYSYYYDYYCCFNEVQNENEYVTFCAFGVRVAH